MNQWLTSGASFFRHSNVELQVVCHAPSSVEVSCFRVWLSSKGSQAALYIAIPAKTVRRLLLTISEAKKRRKSSMNGLMPTAVNAAAALKFWGKHQTDSALESISGRKQLLGD